MRSGWVAGLVAFGVVAAVGLGALVVWQPWRAEPAWLFTYAADSATFTDRGDGAYRVSFAGGDEQFLAFTDRPDRDVASVELDVMQAMWPSMFDSSVPNAVFIEQSPGGGRDSVVVEVRDVSVVDSQLVMDVQVLAETPADRGLSIGGNAWEDIPEQVGAIRLLIDDAMGPIVTASCTAEPGSDETFIMPQDSGELYAYAQACEAAGGTVQKIFSTNRDGGNGGAGQAD